MVCVPRRPSLFLLRPQRRRHRVRGFEIRVGTQQHTQAAFGLQGGYNWSYKNFVYGFEAYFNFLGGRGGANDMVFAPLIYDGRPIRGYTLNYNTPATFFGSLSGRLGLNLGETLVYLTGGIENPFVFLLVAPVTVSAATLPPRNTIVLGMLAFFAASLLVQLHWPLPWFHGEMLVLPIGWKGEWTIHETTRKLYFIKFEKA